MDPHAEEKYLSVLCAVPVKPVYPDGRPYIATGNSVTVTGGMVNNVVAAAAANAAAPAAVLVTAQRSDRPYNCEYCTKTFAKRDKLNRHRKIHTGTSGGCQLIRLWLWSLVCRIYKFTFFAGVFLPSF